MFLRCFAWLVPFDLLRPVNLCVVVMAQTTITLCQTTLMLLQWMVAESATVQQMCVGFSTALSHQLAASGVFGLLDMHTWPYAAVLGYV